MTAPKTNVEKQKRNHWGPLIGIAVVIVFASIMALIWAGGDPITEEDAQDGAGQIQESTDVNSDPEND
ncbi:hypothetical protein [Thalassorhabdomicrobium marinisediminis]|uniref:Uncharacterized protein n=1 Tax=Thalassorhabdomicrobium marinisediminis TaxID=2170577 RepID=A0A2T7FXD8_9RHOB|nr:hypothetical protein [Thalassorhabdomicrobium marinisediminis]PVA06835.1 hypothetical protein DC363_06655 [Thalassorhabdomicrobium marinisediminis]